MATELFIIEIRARGAKKVARDIRRINTAGLAARKTMALFRNALVAVAAIRLFSGVVKVISDFGDSMARIGAITRATAFDFKELRDRAREMGRTTRFTATEAAQGMLELSKAGFETVKVLKSIDDVLDFATVGQIDLAKAAQITAGTLEGFGLDISQVQRVVDTLTAAAHSSLASIEDMGVAMKIVAPFAAKLSVNLEETAAIMAILAKRGIKGTLAATSFRRVLANLENPSGKFAKILDVLSINTERLRPSVVGVTEAFRVLSEAELGASAAADLFGLRGAVAFSILGDLSDGIDDTAAQFAKMEGATKKAADVIEDTLLNDLLLVKAAFQDLLISIGDAGFEEFARNVAQGLIRAFNAINMNIENIKRGIKTLLVSYGLWIVANGALTRALDFATAALLRLWAAMLANPIAALIIGFAGLITALATFGDEIVVNTKTGKTFGDVWDANAEVLGGIALDALNQFGFGFEDFGDIVSFVAKHVGNVFSLMVGVIGAGWVAMNKILDLAKLAWVATTKAMVESMNFFAEVFNATLGRLGAEPLTILDTTGVDAELDRLLESVLNTASDMEDALKKPFRLARDLAAARRANELPFASADPSGRFRGRPAIRDPIVDPGISSPDTTGAAKKLNDALKTQAETLRDLEAALFPVLGLQDRLAEINKIILEGNNKLNQSRRDGIEVIKRAIRADLGFADTTEQVAEKQEVLRKLLKLSVISLEEYRRAVLNLDIALLESQTTAAAGFKIFFLKQKQEAEDAATQVKDLLSNAFKGAQDALLEFVTTGKLNFSSLIDSIISDLARLAIKMATNSIFESIFGGGIGAPGGITGQTNAAQTLFDKLFGGGGVTAGISSGASAALLPMGPSFAHGGSFQVGRDSSIASLPGVDNRLVAFAARDGEDVHVTRKSESGRGDMGDTIINFYVQSEDADSFMRSKSQIQNQLMFGAQTAMRRR